jgi:hypothetical protein
MARRNASYFIYANHATQHADQPGFLGWDAGSALMKAQSPEAWRVLMDAGKLSTAN